MDARLLRAALVIATLTPLTSGCMLGPHHEQQLDSRSSTLRFHGYHLRASSPVTLEGRTISGEWSAFGSARSQSSTPFTFDGQPLYPWQSAELAIPGTYWRAGYRGYRAEVRARWRPLADPSRDDVADGAMVHVRSDWFACAQEHRTFQSFREHCGARYTTAASTQDDTAITVFTRDYCRYPMLAPSLQPGAEAAVLIDRDGGVQVAVPVQRIRVSPEKYRDFRPAEAFVDGTSIGSSTLSDAPVWELRPYLAARGIGTEGEITEWVLEEQPRIRATFAFDNGPSCSPSRTFEVPITDVIASFTHPGLRPPD